MIPLMDSASRERLLANGRNRDQDHPPVIKIFNPSGAQRWLFSELDADDTLFGLCDLGMGTPELGYVSLTELLEVSQMLPVALKRDPGFKGTAPLSVYANAANAVGRIVEMGPIPDTNAKD